VPPRERVADPTPSRDEKFMTPAFAGAYHRDEPGDLVGGADFVLPMPVQVVGA
jgi:hypothetical protein